MSGFQVIAWAGFASAAAVMLLVTQTKQRVAWPAWIVPAACAAASVGITVFAAAEEEPAALWTLLMGSPWGLQIWLDRLMGLTAAFFLLQNRARASGMKSEVWVLLVIFTGSTGLLLMLSRTVYLERARARGDGAGAPGTLD